MRSNHHYGDLSNLNAPYDAVPLQGIGQATDDSAFVDDLPWREFSKDTLQLQQDANFFLFNHKACEIEEDGKLGPATCGALRFVAEKGNIQVVPQTCFNHADEAAQPRPKSPCPASASPGPSPSPSDPEDPDLVKTGGNIPGWAIGLGLGVVAIAVAMAMRKKKGR